MGDGQHRNLPTSVAHGWPRSPEQRARHRDKYRDTDPPAAQSRPPAHGAVRQHSCKLCRSATQRLSRGVSYVIFPTRGDRPSLLSLTSHPSCRAIAEAQKTAEIHHNHDPAITVANHSMNPTENVLTLDWTEDLAAKKIPDTNRLREPHRGGFGQAHAWRRGHASRRGALRMNQVRRRGQETRPKQDTDRHGTHHMPANQGKPLSSQYPPGYLFVTSMAVIHFGFLYPSLVAMRRRTG